jgi:hypothetical protein
MIPMKVQRPIVAWLRANGINPGDVPIDAVATIKDGRITCPVYLRRDGSRYLDKDRNVAMGSVDVPLREQPAGIVADWLAGKVPA